MSPLDWDEAGSSADGSPQGASRSASWTGMIKKKKKGLDPTGLFFKSNESTFLFWFQ